MTRKDFAFIAGVIHAMPRHAITLRTTRASTAHAFSDALARDHKTFNRERFMKAALGEDYYGTTGEN